MRIILIKYLDRKMSSEPLELFRGFLAGALAACGAVTFTNPAEVVKVRLQLQGELQQVKLGVSGGRPFGGALNTFMTILKNEGARGIQRGLGAAYAYQILLNGFRLGMYDPIKNGVNSTMELCNIRNGYLSSISSGAISGVLGAFIASPFFLIKTRMQSFTGGSVSNAVGHQHSYVSKGVLFSLKTIWKNDGLGGLWRGSDASMLRTGVGSAVQLPSYELIKLLLVEKNLFEPSSPALHFVSSLGTGLLICLAMNPFDVAMTRMYNQQDGKMYKSVFDCIKKTIQIEGAGALYKGFTAHFLRIGPHTILTLVFLEQSRLLFGVK